MEFFFRSQLPTTQIYFDTGSKRENMKIKALLFVLLFPLCADAQSANNFLFRNPHPIVQGRAVDLTPLFRWWVNPQAPSGDATNASVRPMPAYVKVTGDILKDEPAGWVVDATVETFPGKQQHEKIFILNPPRKEKTRFEELQAEAGAPSTTPGTSNPAAKSPGAAAHKHQHTKNHTDHSSNTNQVADQSDSSTNAAPASPAAAAAQKPLNAFPFSTYRAEFFAFQTPQRYENLPTMDAGLAFQQ